MFGLTVVELQLYATWLSATVTASMDGEHASALPPELLCKAFSYLTHKEHFALRLVCRKFRNVIDRCERALLIVFFIVFLPLTSFRLGSLPLTSFLSIPMPYAIC